MTERTDQYATAAWTFATALGLDPNRVVLDGGVRIDLCGVLEVTEFEIPKRVVFDAYGAPVVATRTRRLRVTVTEEEP
jgi:hypothetical protein